ncbi:ExbD/TolR family protein [Comamonadaceae bacterium OH2545_COT-014]|nr:ExbD/TolR family protein [Comamonadaceae bacterium OH2545_COT-014]
MPAVASRGRGRRTMNEINMVPFIDVMLVLLIIFMVTATVITPGAINVPSTGQAPRAPDNYLTVAIDAGGQLSANQGRENGQDTELQPAANESELLAHVQQALASQPGLPVLLAADKTLEYQKVMTVMGKLREAGVQRVALSVK